MVTNLPLPPTGAERLAGAAACFGAARLAPLFATGFFAGPLLALLDFADFLLVAAMRSRPSFACRAASALCLPGGMFPAAGPIGGVGRQRVSHHPRAGGRS